MFSRSCFLCFFFLLSSLRIQLHAQVLYGSLTGTVTDATDSLVPSAKVDAANVDTGIVKQTTTDNRGAFLFNNLQPGTYTVTISASSFGSISERGIVVNANTTQRLDAKLQLSTVAETVTVQASAFTLQTDRADVNTQLKTTQIANLPIGSGRNFQALYKLVLSARLQPARRFQLRCGQSVAGAGEQRQRCLAEQQQYPSGWRHY